MLNLNKCTKINLNLNQHSSLRTVHLCVCAYHCAQLSYTVQNSSDPSHPPDNHHSSDDVYWRGRGCSYHDQMQFRLTSTSWRTVKRLARSMSASRSRRRRSSARSFSRASNCWWRMRSSAARLFSSAMHGDDCQSLMRTGSISKMRLHHTANMLNTVAVVQNGLLPCVTY